MGRKISIFDAISGGAGQRTYARRGERVPARKAAPDALACF
jgi:hypothetical protein